MRNFFACAFVVAISFAAVFLSAARPASASGDEPAVLEADKALLQAIGKMDKNAMEHLLDPAFTWIDSSGKSERRAQVLQNMPTPANANVNAEMRMYGRSAVVRVNRGRVQVMRVWAKRPAGWRAVLYQEVTLAVKSEPASTGGSGSANCENPCRSIPYQPETQSEKEAIVSWQGVMKAMANNDNDAYVPLIADEFTATDTHHDRPLNKSDRIAQINKQKLTGDKPVPSALISARMFDFGETVMMIAREQRPGAKPYFNTRMWVNREARWQMLFSFNTRIE
ncbi:MAG: nuclear transport factor 2 family protein [Candidatus Acidiferrales bacterium]